MRTETWVSVEEARGRACTHFDERVVCCKCTDSTREKICQKNEKRQVYRSYKGQEKASVSVIPYSLNGSAHAMQVVKGQKTKDNSVKYRHIFVIETRGGRLIYQVAHTHKIIKVISEKSMYNVA
uniref:Uncharacterized protein n=1 Tax=Rhipicephalus appendiculatus TaxID=34631 RepID=A0A131YE23_RHIAP